MKTDAQKAVIKLEKEIIAKLKLIQIEVAKYKTKANAKNSPVHWGHVGDLDHVSSKLSKLTTFLGA